MENEEIDVSEVIAKKQEAKRKREAKKAKKLEKGHISLPIPEVAKLEEHPNVEIIPESKKKRGRPRKDSLSVDEQGIADPSAKAGSSSSTKRKAKGKKPLIIEDPTGETPKQQQNVSFLV